MLELFFSALITVLPDYLYRRYKQGKRLGHEITLFSVWYELRWGITSGAVLAITLLAVIFYFHPTTSNVTSLFRTVTILSDRGGRVEEVFVTNNQIIRAGEPIFRLDTSRQQAAAETARRSINEVDAAFALARSELEITQGYIQSTRAALSQSEDDLQRRSEVRQRNPNLVSEQEVEVLKIAVSRQEGALAAALAQRDVVQANIDKLLPAQRATAEAALAQAVTEIQAAISTGQLRPSDQLLDLQDRVRPGTVLIEMEPVFGGHADAIPPGSTCVGVAYTSRAAERASGEITGFDAFVSSIVDGMGIANAIVIRAQALLLPIRVLVFS